MTDDAFAKAKEILTKGGIKVIDNPSKAATLVFVEPKGEKTMKKAAQKKK